MFETRRLVATAAVLVTTLPVIGVDRLVVTDGDIPAASSRPAAQEVAFKSDYFPLDK